MTPISTHDAELHRSLGAVESTLKSLFALYKEDRETMKALDHRVGRLENRLLIVISIAIGISFVLPGGVELFTKLL